MPQETLNADVKSRMSLFSIGGHHITSRISRLDGAHVWGWRFHFRQEPEWDFPLELNHLLGSACAG